MAEMVTKKCNGCGEIKPAWKSRSAYCTDCCKQHNRDWEAQHPEKVKARTRIKAHDPTHQQQVSTYRKIKRRTTPEFRAKEISKNRVRRLREKYGLTLEAYQAMIAAQNNCCAICGRSDGGFTRLGRVVDLGVDHDHATGVVRELLCGNCNTGIGNFMDSPMLLWQAIRYLRKHGRPWTTPEDQLF